MGLLGGDARLGTWWVTSKADPRWDKTGHAFGSVMAGGPQEMDDWIEECKKNFGDPPADAEKGFMKD